MASLNRNIKYDLFSLRVKYYGKKKKTNTNAHLEAVTESNKRGDVVPLRLRPIPLCLKTEDENTR